MMMVCGAEELTPSLPFSVSGTGRWHSPHCGPVKRPYSDARSRLAGVGGAYVRMGSRCGRHALASSRLLGEQDPGCLVRMAAICVRDRRAATCAPSHSFGRALAVLCGCYSLPGPFLGWMLGLGEEEEWLC